MALLSPPKIPDPVEPRDFTRGQREHYREIAEEGDPMRDVRDRGAIDRLLTNADTHLMGPTPASTLAMRSQQSEGINENISNYLLQSDRLEAQTQQQAQMRHDQLYSERQRHMDEYEQQVAQTEAMREIQKKNFQSGLIRAGANMLGTVAGVPGVAEFLGIGGDDPVANPHDDYGFETPNAGGYGAMGEDTGPGVSNQNPNNMEVPGVDFGGFGEGIGPEKTTPESDFLGPSSNREDGVLFNNFDAGFSDDYDPLNEMGTVGLYG